MSRGLGRLPAPDERDHAFLMRSAVAEPSRRPRRYWNPNGWWGDQGDTSQCVEFSWHHWVADGPVTHRPKRAPFWIRGEVYEAAKRIDEWEGEDYDGTSVRAGAKVLVERGLITGYTWAFDVGPVVDAVLEVGPVVVGTTWYDDMFEPDGKGRITPTGSVAGGHAYLINGVNKDTGYFRIKNSWGREWGKRGHAYILIDDMNSLIQDYGEACLAIEPGNSSIVKDMFTPVQE